MGWNVLIAGLYVLVSSGPSFPGGKLRIFNLPEVVSDQPVQMQAGYNYWQKKAILDFKAIEKKLKKYHADSFDQESAFFLGLAVFCRSCFLNSLFVCAWEFDTKCTKGKCVL